MRLESAHPLLLIALAAATPPSPSIPAAPARAPFVSCISSYSTNGKLLENIETNLNDASLIYSNLGGQGGRPALLPRIPTRQEMRMGNVGRLRDGTVIDLVITNRSECTQQQPHTSLTTSRIHPARMHAEHLPLRDTYHTAYTARHRSPPVPPRIPRRPRLQRPPKRSPIQGQGRGRLWRIQPEGTIDVFNRRAAARLVRRASVHLHGQREQRAARATAHATHLLRLRQRPQWPSRVHADPGNPRELDHVVRLRQDGADGGRL